MDAVTVDTRALGRLRSVKNRLTRKQFKTLRGQILSGDQDGAMRGLSKILGMRGDNHSTRQAP